MYKKVATFIITITLLNSPSNLYATDIPGGLSQFIYGLLYLNIGTTSCKEITDKEGGREGSIAQMKQLVETANSMAGKDTIDMNELIQYFDDLYEYCENNPDEIFAQALAKIARPLFTIKNRHGTHMRNNLNNHNSRTQNQWSSMGNAYDTNQPSSQENSRTGPQIID